MTKEKVENWMNECGATQKEQVLKMILAVYLGAYHSNRLFVLANALAAHTMAEVAFLTGAKQESDDFPDVIE